VEPSTNSSSINSRASTNNRAGAAANANSRGGALSNRAGAAAIYSRSGAAVNRVGTAPPLSPTAAQTAVSEPTLELEVSLSLPASRFMEDHDERRCETNI